MESPFAEFRSKSAEGTDEPGVLNIFNAVPVTPTFDRSDRPGLAGKKIHSWSFSEIKPETINYRTLNDVTVCSARVSLARPKDLRMPAASTSA
jgi:hypothetical protein